MTNVLALEKYTWRHKGSQNSLLSSRKANCINQQWKKEHRKKVARILSSGVKNNVCKPYSLMLFRKFEIQVVVNNIYHVLITRSHLRYL